MPLPPDPENMNDRRAAWVADCLGHFRSLTGAAYGQEALGDLLANMWHWCDRNGVDMEAMIETARGCYREEIREIDEE